MGYVPPMLRAGLLRRRVRTYLAVQGMTQIELAKELGIAPSHLSGILSHKQVPSLRVAVALEALTSIPPRDLLRAVER